MSCEHARGVEVELYSFFNLGVGVQRHALVDALHGNSLSICSTDGWVGLRVRLDGCGNQKIVALKGFWIPNRPARSKSLYRWKSRIALQLFCQLLPHLLSWGVTLESQTVGNVRMKRVRILSRDFPLIYFMLLLSWLPYTNFCGLYFADNGRKLNNFINVFRT
jgi:hypothetical protein